MEGIKSRYRKEEIPNGLRELLESLTFDVLKAQPEDVLTFCVENLTQKLYNRSKNDTYEATAEETLRSEKPAEIKLVSPKQPFQGEPEEDAKDTFSSTEGGPVVHPVQIENKGVEVDLKDGKPPDEGAAPLLRKYESFMSEEFTMSQQCTSVQRRQGVMGVSIDPEKAYNYKITMYPKSEEQKEKLMQVVHDIHLLRCLDIDDHIELVNAMFECKVEPGEEIIKYGEDGDNFYIIEDGNYEIYTMKDKIMQKITEYKGKGSFGELALLYNTPRSVTVIAITKGTLWVIKRDIFHAIITMKAFKKRKLYQSLLEKVDILNFLTPYERINLVDILQTRIVEKNEVIFLQGELSYEMYFILSGSVKVISEENNNELDKQQVELYKLQENDYFGELALLTTNPRTESVYALEQTCLAVLDVNSFYRLLGPYQEVLYRKLQVRLSSG